jgi:hypothetical protein
MTLRILRDIDPSDVSLSEFRKTLPPSQIDSEISKYRFKAHHPIRDPDGYITVFTMKDSLPDFVMQAVEQNMIEVKQWDKLLKFLNEIGRCHGPFWK